MTTSTEQAQDIATIETAEEYYSRLSAIALTKCHIETRGSEAYLIHAGEELYQDKADHHLHHAWCIMGAGIKGGVWRNASTLIKLRQALREHCEQDMPINPPLEPSCWAGVKEFLTVARAFDRVHHGAVTF